MNSVSKFLILSGFVLIIAGLIWHFSGGKIPIGKLPGDIYIKKPGMSFYFPITSSIIVSLVISGIMLLIKKFK